MRGPGRMRCWTTECRRAGWTMQALETALLIELRNGEVALKSAEVSPEQDGGPLTWSAGRD